MSMMLILAAAAAVRGAIPGVSYLSSQPHYATFSWNGGWSETIYELSAPERGKLSDPSEWIAKVTFISRFGDRPEPEVLTLTARACPAVFTVAQSLSTLPQARPADPLKRIPSPPPIDGSSYRVSFDIDEAAGQGTMSYFVHHFGDAPTEGTIVGWVQKAMETLGACLPAARAAARTTPR